MPARSPLADRHAPALAEATGLSREGVHLALAHALETTPTDGELDALVAGVTPEASVAVVLSANVFVAAHRALALALAASPTVVVRPSRREPLFARLLVEATGGLVRLDPTLDVAELREGTVHVYGRDATIAALRARATVPVLGKGHGRGVVLLGPSPADEAIAGLARDVALFDQRGCASPRIVWAVDAAGDGAAPRDVAARLHEALGALGESVPRGLLDAEERAAVATWRATRHVVGEIHEGPHHAVAVGGAPDVSPSPVGRHVAVAGVASVAEARALLAPVARWVVAVGSDELAFADALAPEPARRALVGQVQRPPLDGPMDRRAG